MRIPGFVQRIVKPAVKQSSKAEKQISKKAGNLDNKVQDQRPYYPIGLPVGLRNKMENMGFKHISDK